MSRKPFETLRLRSGQAIGHPTFVFELSANHPITPPAGGLPSPRMSVSLIRTGPQLSIIDNPCHERYSSSMPLNVNLTPELEGLIRQKVSSGRYNSASEVVREALRLMEAEDQLRAAKLQQLRNDIQ